jgi:uncharacterized Ntn-hydrolase superfamily protein
MRVLCVMVFSIACQHESRLDSSSATPPMRPAGCRIPGGPSSGADTTISSITGSPLRPAHTFSIVARDPVTGDLGVAVQSHWFSTGSVVVWAEPGVGAVATQSFVEPAYGPKGLALMREGVPAPEAMAKLLAADPQGAVRQLGFVDASGKAAAHTGARCIQSAGHLVGDGFAVQANLMWNDRVWPAMKAAYESTRGDLAERMLAALDAAQAAGGDIRGCQSAAMLIVSGKKSATPWAEKKIDLRVEDHAAPLVELRRLVTLARAYDHMNQGDAAVEKNDMKAAAEHYGAATQLVPDEAEMPYWQGIAYASRGDIEHAGPLLRRAFAADPAWIELTRRLPAANLLPDTATAERAIAAGR